MINKNFSSTNVEKKKKKLYYPKYLTNTPVFKEESSYLFLLPFHPFKPRGVRI